MTREEKTAILVAYDIINIEIDLFDFEGKGCDYDYLWAILTGEGFTQYNNMTAKEITDELNERWDEIADSERILMLAHKLNGEPIKL